MSRAFRLISLVGVSGAEGLLTKTFKKTSGLDRRVSRLSGDTITVLAFCSCLQLLYECKLQKNTKQNKNKNSQNQSICQSLLDFSKCEQWVTTNPGPLSFILNSNVATFNVFQDKSRAGVCIISIHFGRNNYLTYELIQRD